MWGLPQWLRAKESTWNIGEANSVPGLRRSPGNPLQSSCLENPVALQATVQSDTTEATLHTCTHAKGYEVVLKISLILCSYFRSEKYQFFVAHGPLTHLKNRNSFSQSWSENFFHEENYIQVALCHDNLDYRGWIMEDNLLFFGGGAEKQLPENIFLFILPALFVAFESWENYTLRIRLWNAV